MNTLTQSAPEAQAAVSEREAFLAARRTGIGGSDAAAVVGLNRYKTPYDVYLEKRGEIEPEDLSDVAPVKWGIRLEDAVADEYMERTGKTVHRVLRTLRHPEHPFMLAHLDRRVVGEKRGLEIKTAGQWAALSDEWGPSGSDQVPEQYLIQTQHYMGVTGYEVFDLAVLIAGSDFRIYEIPRDEEIISMLIEAESDFWKRVQTGEPPAITTVADARKRFSKSLAKSIEASADIAMAILNMREIEREMDALTARYEPLQAQVMAFMGDADTLVRGDEKLCTWKTARAFMADRFAAENPEIAKEFSLSEIDKASLKKAHAKLYEAYMSPGATRKFKLEKVSA